VINNNAIGLRSIRLALPKRFVPLTGRVVPDHLVVMRNFQSAETIAETFCRS
jgi:hypothetical protein